MCLEGDFLVHHGISWVSRKNLPVGAGVGQGGSPDDAGGALGYGSSAVAAHVGGDPSGADGVDGDLSIGQFGGEFDGQRVQTAALVTA